jgi:hypothetical protein
MIRFTSVARRLTTIGPALNANDWNGISFQGKGHDLFYAGKVDQGFGKASTAQVPDADDPQDQANEEDRVQDGYRMLSSAERCGIYVMTVSQRASIRLEGEPYGKQLHPNGSAMLGAGEIRPSQQRHVDRAGRTLV